VERPDDGRQGDPSAAPYAARHTAKISLQADAREGGRS